MQKHIETNLHHVKGEGSAHSGTRHWWLMKISSVAMLPLVLWFFFSLLCVLFAANFHHAELGGQEVIVDYVHQPLCQKWLLMLYKLFCAAAAIISIASVFYIFFKM
jgi:succinate dehydrogenase / fumarate reductase, membrane anchor subunit